MDSPQHHLSVFHDFFRVVKIKSLSHNKGNKNVEITQRKSCRVHTSVSRLFL